MSPFAGLSVPRQEDHQTAHALEKQMESASPHQDEDRRPRAGESSRSWHAEALIQLLILAVGIALGVIYLRHEFANRFSIHGDVAQHAYWMVTYHQPDLFPNDLYVKYARSLSTPGLQAIYWVATLFATPVRVGKIIAVTLFGITGWLYYRIGRSFHGRSTGYLVAFIWLVFPNHIGEIDGGLHRSFMHPLLAAVAYALCTRKIKLVGWLLAVGLFVYPPAALVSAVTLGIFFLLEPSALRLLYRRRWGLAGWGMLVVAAIVLWLSRRHAMPDFLGPMVTGQEMVEDPRFSEGGRSPYLPFDLLWHSLRIYMFNSNEVMMALCWLALLLVPVRFIQTRSAFRDAAPMVALFAASVLLFELAKAIHFKLYIPRRYLQFSPVLVGAMLMGLAGAGVFQFLRYQWMRAAVLALAIWQIWGDSRGDIARYFRDGRYDESGRGKMYKYLAAETPKDSLIAADPKQSDAITVFASRMTLLKYELSHPWFKNYRAMVEERARDYYAMVYADSPDALRLLRDKYGLDYIIFDPWNYRATARRKKRLFYEPLDSELQYRFPVDDEKEYLLERLARLHGGFQCDRYEVLPLDDETLGLLEKPGEDPAK
jgi:hypothetical protein